MTIIYISPIHLEKEYHLPEREYLYLILDGYKENLLFDEINIIIDKIYKEFRINLGDYKNDRKRR